MLDWNDYLRMFTGLIAIVGPLSTVPLFLNFTENLKSRRKRIARTSGFAVGLILSVSVLAGSRILDIFNISIDGFRVAGVIEVHAVARIGQQVVPAPDAVRHVHIDMGGTIQAGGEELGADLRLQL